jgi:hypothetical protein
VIRLNGIGGVTFQTRIDFFDPGFLFRSDVLSPLLAQPDPGIVATYVSDYDYASALATKHLASWVDGRVALNRTYEQDAFTDTELGHLAPLPFGRGGAEDFRLRVRAGQIIVPVRRWAICRLREATARQRR